MGDAGNRSSICEACFAEKWVRSLTLIQRAYEHFGDRLVVEHKLTKDSCVVWDLAKRVSPKIKGFCIATRFQPPEAIQFMKNLAERYPEIIIFESLRGIPDDLPRTDPYLCCEVLRDQQKHHALEVLNVACLATGFHHARGSLLFDMNEFQKVPDGLFEFTPILAWSEADISEYLTARRIPLTPLHEKGPGAFSCSACVDALGVPRRLMGLRELKSALSA